MKITSLQNDFVKHCTKLSKKKYRDEHNEVLIEGEHLIQEAHAAGIVKKTIGLTEKDDIQITEHIAQKLSNTISGSNQFAVISKPQRALTHADRYLICDGVQDPGNLGTIIRTAHSFGFDAVVVSETCVDEFNDKVIRSTQGSIFHIPVIRMTLDLAITQIKAWNIPVYASYLGENTHNLQDIKTCPIAVVMGSEGSGVSDAVVDLCDGTVKIETSQFESLNVAIASAIICYTLRK
ncbi:RNA methyltransferase [Erysipelothrix amsterdamensis]|uniref:RNA methyltransferase n=1 Tax=Erysipelothrix amsterdamensis TaxID=2929157 RepID=A0AAU9VHA5_9FIRM|nr:RNA methyltransferase [Erysipelothrix sp. A18Y020d]CAH2762940.1 RNA methyltransferase [Erysipelothrix sp. A18Y020d]